MCAPFSLSHNSACPLQLGIGRFHYFVLMLCGWANAADAVELMAVRQPSHTAALWMHRRPASPPSPARSPSSSRPLQSASSTSTRSARCGRAPPAVNVLLAAFPLFHAQARHPALIPVPPAPCPGLGDLGHVHRHDHWRLAVGLHGRPLRPQVPPHDCPRHERRLWRHVRPQRELPHVPRLSRPQRHWVRGWWRWP